MSVELVMALIIKYAKLNDIEPALALAVAKVESNFDPKKIGAAGEIGVYQLHPAYHKGPYTLETGIQEGIETLKAMKKACPSDRDSNSFVLCYNRGVVGASKMSYTQMYEDVYYKKVKDAYNEFIEKHYR